MKKNNYLNQISEYISFEKNNENASISLLSSVVYSRSEIFNSFDYKRKLIGIKYLSVKISKNLIFDTFLYILIDEIRTFCKLEKIQLNIISENEYFDAYYDFLASKKIGKLQKEKHNSVILFFEGLGKTTQYLINDLFKFIEFTGELIKRIVYLP